MGNRHKNKKNKQPVGGLQPKGGAYANRDAAVAAAGLDLDVAVSGDTAIDEKSRVKAEKIRAKVKARESKEKIKKEKKKEKKEKGRLLRALRETGSELKKVRWPSLSVAIKQTGVVLGVVVVFSLVVFGLDRGLGALHDLLTRRF